jgi:riboflavin transporter FmnP
MNNVYNVKKMTMIGVMSALVTVLSFVQFPFPMAPYMKFDPNDIVVLICVICLGYKSTLSIVSIRSVIRFVLTGGIFGEIAAFSSSIIFMSTYHFMRIYIVKNVKYNSVKYALSCLCSIIVSTSMLMVLNYVFITPSNISQSFTTGWELMDSWGMSNRVYINTFIIPVMVFNLIKWSVISIVSGITQVKIPSRYLNRCDTTIFKEVYKIDNVKEKEDEYVKE